RRVRDEHGVASVLRRTGRGIHVDRVVVAADRFVIRLGGGATVLADRVGAGLIGGARGHVAVAIDDRGLVVAAARARRSSVVVVAATVAVAAARSTCRHAERKDRYR